MTAITFTPGGTLRDIALAACRVAPSGIDFSQTPDGKITFTDVARPGEQFRVGPDIVYAGEDVDGIAWSEWTIETGDDGRVYEDVAGSDGCSLSDPTDLVAALTRWIDADLGTLMDYDTAEPIGPATREQTMASLAAGPEGGILIDADGRVRDASEFGADTFRDVYVV